MTTVGQVVSCDVEILLSSEKWRWDIKHHRSIRD